MPRIFLALLLACLAWPSLSFADVVGPPVVVSVPAGFQLVPITAPAPVVPVAPEGYTLVPTDDASSSTPEADAKEGWWMPLLRNADIWAFVLMAFFGILKLLKVKKIDQYQKDFASIVQIAYRATEEAGFRGEVPKGAKAPAFGKLFETLMDNRGHKDLSSATRGAAQAEADALNDLAREKAAAPAPVDPTPAPSVP